MARRGAKSKWSDVIKNSVQTAAGPIQKYLLNTVKEELNGDGLVRRLTFGKNNPKTKNRTIILVGESGAGKSVLINMMLNYMLGVKWKDDIRFEIIPDEGSRPQSESQTIAITAYEIFGLEGLTVPFSLTVIDTPGYTNTKGQGTDDKIAQNLYKLLNSLNGVQQMNAACLVVKASVNRLNRNQKYILDTVLSLFGKDMEKNFLTLITFSDWTPPAAVGAVVESGIPFLKDKNNEPVLFLFNNHPLRKPEAYEDEYKRAWGKGSKSMKEFFKTLDQMETQNLKMTENVLRERQRLDATFQSLMRQIEVQEMKHKALKDHRKTLEDHKEDIMKNNNFQYEYEEVVMKLVSTDRHATRCTKCETNCHYPGCWWVSSKRLNNCEVMKAGKCTVCPGHCSYKDHKKEKKIYVPEMERKSGTYEELKKNKEGEIAEEEEVLSKLEQELKDIKAEINRLQEQYQQCTEELKEHSLKFDSAPVHQHISRMIKVAKKFKDAEKVEALKSMLNLDQQEDAM